MITVAAGPYAHLAGFADDAADGLELSYDAIEPGHIFPRMLRDGAWDVAEMSLATAYILADRGDRRFIALPVFPSRAFRHSALYVPAGRAIRGVEALRHGRVGVLRYAMTTAVWVRAMLARQYSIPAAGLSWSVGEDSPHPAAVEPKIVAGAAALEQMTVDGELDCLISGRTPSAFLDGRLERLFPAFGDEEKDYYRSTGVFPIMHVMLAKRALFDAKPSVLPALLQRFEISRRRAEEGLLNFDISIYPLPWLAAYVEDARRSMSGSLWPYGIDANRVTLTAFGEALAAEGLTGCVRTPEEVFIDSPS